MNLHKSDFSTFPVLLFEDHQGSVPKALHSNGGKILPRKVKEARRKQTVYSLLISASICSATSCS